jgi:hypothetical protein
MRISGSTSPDCANAADDSASVTDSAAAQVI